MPKLCSQYHGSTAAVTNSVIVAVEFYPVLFLSHCKRGFSCPTTGSRTHSAYTADVKFIVCMRMSNDAKGHASISVHHLCIVTHVILLVKRRSVHLGTAMTGKKQRPRRHARIHQCISRRAVIWKNTACLATSTVACLCIREHGHPNRLHHSSTSSSCQA